MSGPAKFPSQPIYAAHVVIDGVEFREIPRLDKIPTAAGANLIEMADGSRVVQLPYLSATSSLSPRFYEFSWEQQADFEDEWYQIDELAQAADAVWMIPHTVEVEVWRLASGINSLSMARPTAAAKYGSFDPLFVNRAFVNGTEQTVVASGTPGTGEIMVGGASGSEVLTPALSAGDLLSVRYYAAYPVIFINLGESHESYNTVVRSARCYEVNRQVPS